MTSHLFDGTFASNVGRAAPGALTTIPEMLVISPFENAKLVQQLDKTGRIPWSVLHVCHALRGAERGKLPPGRFVNTGETLKFLATRGGPTGLYTGWLPMQVLCTPYALSSTDTDSTAFSAYAARMRCPAF
eukprot:3119856-Rhodomonas_salina.2